MTQLSGAKMVKLFLKISVVLAYLNLSIGSILTETVLLMSHAARSGVILCSQIMIVNLKNVTTVKYKSLTILIVGVSFARTLVVMNHVCFGTLVTMIMTLKNGDGTLLNVPLHSKTDLESLLQMLSNKLKKPQPLSQTH